MKPSPEQQEDALCGCAHCEIVTPGYDEDGEPAWLYLRGPRKCGNTEGTP